MSGLGLTFLRRGGQAHPTAGIPRIQFADTQVEQISFAKGVGNGEYITPEDAASVSSISTWFNSADIKSFNEFQYFTSVTYLADKAFSGCKFSDLTLPENLSTFGWKTFTDPGCPNLRRLRILNPAKVISATSNSLTGLTGLQELYVPDNLLEDYKIASYWKNFATKIKPLSEYNE